MRFFIFLFFISSVVYTQDYMPIDTLDQDERKKNKNLFVSKLNDIQEKLTKKYPKGVSSDIKENLEEFETFFSKSFDKASYVYKTPFNKIVDSIYKEIYLTNPNVPSDLQVVVSRNISLNALCLINGTLIVNMGAIRFLENEDQLAAILCHEISHKLLQHSEKAIVETASEKYSQISKQENRNIRQKKYNRQKIAFSILKEKLYAKSKNQQEHEFEADSLGYLLLKNTKYNAPEFLRALELSSKFDTIQPANLDLVTYRTVFDTPDQPFNEHWFEKEDFSQYDYVFEEKLSSDSLSTHPEINERIEELQRDFIELKNFRNQNFEYRGRSDYHELRTKAKKEQVPSLFYEKKYGFCIYLALYRIQQNYLIDFHKEWLGKAFYQIFNARKLYMANKYLDRIDPEKQTESYQQFINFMWNLRLEEIKKIAIFYGGDSTN